MNEEGNKKYQPIIDLAGCLGNFLLMVVVSWLLVLGTGFLIYERWFRKP